MQNCVEKEFGGKWSKIYENEFCFEMIVISVLLNLSQFYEVEQLKKDNPAKKYFKVLITP